MSAATNAYVYRWDLRPRADIRVELQIEARDAIAARREVVAFLHQHDAGSWQIESVSRTPAMSSLGPPAFEALPAACLTRV